jgi:multicomponent Na+:H+ antiporter subunit E
MSAPTQPSASGSPPSRLRFLAAEAVILMLLWVVLSGWYDIFHTALGIATVAFVLWLNREARGLPRELTGGSAVVPLHLWRLVGYLPWLFWQMLSSGLYVAYLSLHPRAPISPLVVRFRSHQPSLSAQVVLGNSITLTPGTLTLDLLDGELTVHALNDRTAEGFLRSSMAARVARLYGRLYEPLVSDVRRIRSRAELQGP